MPFSSSACEVAHTRSTAAVRPNFTTHNTADRLREASAMPLKMSGNIQKGRRSVFREVGLEDEFAPAPSLDSEGGWTESIKDENGFGSSSKAKSETPSKKQQEDIKCEAESLIAVPRRQSLPPSKPWYARLPLTRPRIRSTSDSAGRMSATLPRFTMIAMLIAVIIPAFSFSSSGPNSDISGAEAGPIIKRETSPTKICRRWAHQAANVNGTVYIYGGEATTEEDQEEDTWNNYLLTLDLTTNWDIDSPTLKGLEVPDGPPKVAMGYLWQDYDNLYLYGGMGADNPPADPPSDSLWRFSIADAKWDEFKEPKTSEGNYSEPENQRVQRSAEGAGVSVPELGLSWYFGGHLDWATTRGWSNQIDRVYLKSLLEFTHPGYSNTGVNKLQNAGAADGGVFRNITSGGVQKDGFPERADGVLVFVPGWGEQGVLIGLAGGTEDTFTDDLSTLDVYDIANSEWFHQETSGESPSVRVNPCAVIASAPDASSFQIYMFGGQNLQPAGKQTQYDDMYILTIPSFTWIKVKSSDDTPSARAGHTCTMRDGQMVVVGGYVGNDGKCDSPGVYVFDASNLKWTSGFKAGDHSADYSLDNSVLAGSYGYTVPDLVQSEIGGDQEGGATATIPAAGPATGGPFATGKPPVFTVTAPGSGPTVTQPGGADDDTNDSDGDDVNPGLIAAGVIAGVFGALACYLGFCAWLYRRQVNAYQTHLAMANRYSSTGLDRFGHHATMAGAGANHQENEFDWVGSRTDPPWLAEPKSSSDEWNTGSASGSGTAVWKKSSENRRNSYSGESTEGLLDGQEPSFFSVVLQPRRALRVVNGLDERVETHEAQ